MPYCLHNTDENTNNGNQTNTFLANYVCLPQNLFVFRYFYVILLFIQRFLILYIKTNQCHKIIKKSEVIDLNVLSTKKISVCCMQRPLHPHTSPIHKTLIACSFHVHSRTIHVQYMHQYSPCHISYIQCTYVQVLHAWYRAVYGHTMYK